MRRLFLCLLWLLLVVACLYPLCRALRHQQGAPIASIAAPELTAAGVGTDTWPWTVWVSGTNLAPEHNLVAHLRDTTGAPWLTLYGETGPSVGVGFLRYVLPGDIPPSHCNAAAPCTVSLTLTDATTGLVSAPIALTLPRDP